MSELKIHPTSTGTDLPLFNHWEVPPTQRDVERTLVTEHRPIATLSSSSNIEFHFRSGYNEHVLLNKTNLYVKLNITLKAKTGKTITNADWKDVLPANYLLHSLFKNVEVLINGKETCSKPGTYAYRAFLDAKFGFTNDAKSSHLSSALWEPDAAKRIKYFTPKTSSSNQSKSNEVELMGRLHVDLAFQGKTLLGGSDVRVVLTPHDPSFYFQIKSTNENVAGVDVSFKDASLYATTAILHQSFLDHHTDGLHKSPAKYFMTAAEVRHDTIPVGSLDKSFDNVCNGRLPRLVIVQLVESEAQNGSFSQDPYYFNHFDLKSICAYVNGHQVPLNAYQMDFDKGQYLRAFMSLPQSVNQDGMDSILSVNRSNYITGNVHIGLNLSQDGSTGITSSVNPLRFGNLRIVMRFNKDTPKTLSALFYCSYDHCIEINETRSLVV